VERKRRAFRDAAVSADAASPRSHANAWGQGPVARNSDVLPAAVVRALGTSPRAAADLLWGPLNLARRCARVIAALKTAGADEALVDFIQPIDLAIHAAQPSAVTGNERLEEGDRRVIAPAPSPTPNSLARSM